MGWCRSSFIGPAEVASFSTRDFSRSNKHDTLTCSIDWIFLRFILMSHSYYRFSSLRPSFVYYYFIVNSHVNNHFCKYICFKYYTVSNHFFIKTHVEVFYIQIWFKRETQLLFFLIIMVCRKSLYRKIVFSVDYVKIIELHVVHTKVNGKLSI